MEVSSERNNDGPSLAAGNVNNLVGNLASNDLQKELECEVIYYMDEPPGM